MRIVIMLGFLLFGCCKSDLRLIVTGPDENGQFNCMVQHGQGKVENLGRLKMTEGGHSVCIYPPEALTP